MHRIIIAAVLVAGCGSSGDDGPVPVVRSFVLTAPSEPVELLPIAGDHVDFAWSADADLADQVPVIVSAVSTTTSDASQIAFATLDAGAATYVMPPGGSGVLPLPPPLPAGVYRMKAVAYHDGDPLAESTAPGILFRQGIVFRERELTFTADPTQRDIWMTAVTASTARVRVYVQPLLGLQHWDISDATIASDLAPVGRVVTFTGRDLHDQPIPAGDYDVFGEVTARAGAATYLQAGLTIHWQP